MIFDNNLIPGDLLIALIFCLGFFVESIIGFGGSLVSFAILGSFIDIKNLILIALYIATCASILVIISDHKSFAPKIFFRAFPLSFLGTILGVTAFIYISSKALLICFAAFLILLSIKITFFDNIKFHKNLNKLILVIGGFSQGMFGIGGPFFVIALKNRFQNKSELRATMAGFFISFNIVRFVQLSLQNKFDNELFFDFWWMPLPLFLAIHLGHKVHLKISEKTFKKGICALCFFAGIVFLFK